MISGQTSFSDVCGTMDELKRLLREEYDKVSSKPSGTLNPLLSDALFMLGRMKKRIEEYKTSRKKLRDILSQLERIKDVDAKKAEDAIAIFRDCTKSKETFENADTEKMSEFAEKTRSVANALEHCLRTYKDLILKIHDVFVEIKGKRHWLITEDAKLSLVEAIKREHQAWLPPEPHGRKLLEWLSASRAHIPEQRGPGGEPVVQFEDGGCILMSQVRWNPEIQNFHPTSVKPGSTGRKYRRQ